jgi:hypothetical protein
MTFLPYSIPHGVLSGLLLPLRMLGAIKRDVFFDYPHVAVVVAPAAQLQLLRSETNFTTCESTGRAGLDVLERVCLGTVVSPSTKTPGGLDSWLLPVGSHICAEAPCTVPVRAGCHHSRRRANSGCLGTSVGGTPAEGKTWKCNQYLVQPAPCLPTGTPDTGRRLMGKLALGELPERSQAPRDLLIPFWRSSSDQTKSWRIGGVAASKYI